MIELTRGFATDPTEVYGLDECLFDILIAMEDFKSFEIDGPELLNRLSHAIAAYDLASTDNDGA